MSCPVNLPADVFHPVPSRDGVKSRSLAAPRASQWDPQLSLELCSRRMPRLLLHEKALRLAQRHVRHCGASRGHCFFLGSVDVDADEEGVTVTLDRFDPGREQAGASGRVPAAPLPGGVLVPCLISNQRASDDDDNDDVVPSEAELWRSSAALQAHLSGRQPLDLGQLMRVKGRVRCQQQGGPARFSLGWSSLWPSVRLDVRPVRPVPVAPAPSLESLSGTPGGPRRGFLTMNESRTLLGLLMESDPPASDCRGFGVCESRCGVGVILPSSSREPPRPRRPPIRSLLRDDRPPRPLQDERGVLDVIEERDGARD
ncbi:SCL-interrupting locus protein homolog [Syngnathoides biaculeatus]|uniref:SCL-interrupting locus protein homolog n=1 Tax=Syngnathoides biaculeatus TaxID=300417 RepID=UPI002ADDF62B|nr:SCL-interrupting locus protein homolog [Syngnathoides biaculeatus]